MEAAHISPLDDEALVAALCDLVVPADPHRHRPAPSDLGITAQLVAALRVGEPWMSTVVEDGLANLQAAAKERDPGGLCALGAEERAELLRHVEADQPFLVMALALALLPIYYRQPAVLVAIGEAARPGFPEGHTIADTDPQLLRILHTRGKP